MDTSRSSIMGEAADTRRLIATGAFEAFVDAAEARNEARRIYSRNPSQRTAEALREADALWRAAYAEYLRAKDGTGSEDPAPATVSGQWDS